MLWMWPVLSFYVIGNASKRFYETDIKLKNSWLSTIIEIMLYNHGDTLTKMRT